VAATAGQDATIAGAGQRVGDGVRKRQSQRGRGRERCNHKVAGALLSLLLLLLLLGVIFVYALRFASCNHNLIKPTATAQEGGGARCGGGRG